MNSFRTRAEHDRNVAADDRQHRQHREPELPVDRQQQRRLAPMIRNTDDTSDAMPGTTNILMASMSDVRLVSSVAGVVRWI